MKRLNTQKLGIFIVLLLGAISIIFILSNQNNSGTITENNQVKRFTTQQEVTDFLKTQNSQGYYGGNIGIATLEATTTKASGETPAPQAAQDSSTRSSSDYSTTNIQVEGVDEADIVKNDGKYIYVVSQNKIYIINAYPASTQDLISTIDVNGSVDEIFLNGDKLIVFGRENYNYNYPVLYDGDISLLKTQEATSSPSAGGDSISSGSAITPSAPSSDAKIAASSRLMPPIYYNPKSFIKVYDIQDRENPKIYNSLVYDGDYYDSRMIGEYVYVILNQPIYLKDDVVVMPQISTQTKELSVAPTDIYYFGYPDYSYRLTTVLSLNVNNIDTPTKKSFLTGYTQNIFVSENNIYLTSQKQISYEAYQEELTRKLLVEIVDKNTQSKILEVLSDNKLAYYDKQQKIEGLFEEYFNTLSQEDQKAVLQKRQQMQKDIETQIQKELQKTIIHKIQIKGTSIDYKSRGEVPGVILNQFSLDEHNSYLRVATTTGEVWDDTSLNHIYVLDENLNIVGSLENLAPKEKIYSARFIGDRVYLVTFKNIDPLFVIDLSNPINPKVLGELKIPGYSNYLHSYDENHIIGIGKEAVDASDQDRNFAYYQGIKIALFDVTDVAIPKEISKFNIGDRGTDSPALYDHKAFLFDKDKELLVIPVQVAQIDPQEYKGNVPQWAYGRVVFQGAYVLNVNLKDGITLKDRITHDDGTKPDWAKDDLYYVDYLAQIQRSLYIGDTLYTVSQKYVKANSLDTLKEISTVALPQPKQEDYPPYIAY